MRYGDNWSCTDILHLMHTFLTHEIVFHKAINWKDYLVQSGTIYAKVNLSLKFKYSKIFPKLNHGRLGTFHHCLVTTNFILHYNRISIKYIFFGNLILDINAMLAKLF